MSVKDANYALNILPARRRTEHALVIFHPIDEELGHAAAIINDIVATLLNRGMFVFASAPNTDPGNRQILHAIEHLAHHPQVHFYKTLPRDLFVSLFKQAKLIIGNSSAGIMEAASIPIPAVNVGRRQRGRLAGSNVLFSDSDRTSIEAAVATALSEGFQREIAPIRNIYGDGHSAATAYELITTIPFRDFLKKPEDPLEVVVL